MVFKIAGEKGVNMQELYVHFITFVIILSSFGTLSDVGYWSAVCVWSHSVLGQQIQTSLFA